MLRANIKLTFEYYATAQRTICLNAKMKAIDSIRQCESDKKNETKTQS